MPSKLTKDQFIEKALMIHGDRYDYSKTVYQRSTDDVCFICIEHGDFYGTPKNHLKGRNCPKCARKTRGTKLTKSTTQFITQAITHHGDKYDYSLVNYTKSSEPVSIICKTHGLFHQNAANHLNGRGCNECADVIRVYKLTSSIHDVINKWTQTHGDKYDYSLVEYHTTHSKVQIKCTDHGIFLQTPASHAQGSGCPECAQSSPKGTKVYLIEMKTDTEHFGKIGIMKDTIQKRYPGWQSRCNITTHAIIDCPTIMDARSLETQLLKVAMNHKIEPALLKDWRGGWTESFSPSLIPDILHNMNINHYGDPTGETE